MVYMPRCGARMRRLGCRAIFRRFKHGAADNEAAKAAVDITLKGMVLNIFLSGSKFTAGVASNSPALISDGAHSFRCVALFLVPRGSCPDILMLLCSCFKTFSRASNSQRHSYRFRDTLLSQGCARAGRLAAPLWSRKI